MTEPIQKRKITRNRELRACTECRRRKLKCDRKLPCACCSRRGEITACFYEGSSEGLQREHRHRLQAEAKLEHLEHLVQQLSESQPTSTSLGANFASDRLREDIPAASVYTGATHWSAMLEDIEEIRNAIGESDDLDDARTLESNGDDGIGLLFGAAKSLSFQQIICNFLPQRDEVDRLVAAYFRRKAIAAAFIHSAQFNRYYQLFWNNPSTTSPLWASILFSICDISTRTLSPIPETRTGDNNKNTRFATAAAHCLASGNYYKPQRFAVEALLLYAQARCLTSVDMSANLAILFGTISRLATTMGYHKDASSSREGVSAFEGEMRRRTWSSFMQLDMLVSFQLGLPSNVQFPTWDTRPPTNLLDSDFDENSVQLPPARPDSETTEPLFYIAKHKLMVVFEKIIRHTLSPADESSIEELNPIGQELQRTYDSLPSIFHSRSMANSIFDSPNVVVTRLCVHSIYQKCLCVLHQKYVARGRQESTKICYDAASLLVAQFLELYKEFEPGGQLETERWFMGSISWHDFLLGCTALCLTVCSTRHASAISVGSGIVDMEVSLSLLQRSIDVCEKLSHRSKDAQKVRRLVEATILRFGRENDGNISAAQTSTIGGPDMLPEMQLESNLSLHEDEWQWNESVGQSTDNETWAYLEQFLDLSNEEFGICT